MTRYKLVNGERIAFTCRGRKLEMQEKVYADDAPNRRMGYLRSQRDVLLAETDWMANSDVTMSTAWRNYRQALRDITTQTPTDDALSNITFPTKPTE